jgi:hypothetical protein
MGWRTGLQYPAVASLSLNYHVQTGSVSHPRGLHERKLLSSTRPEDHLARPSPSPKFTYKPILDRSPVYLQSALTIVLLIHVSLNVQMPIIVSIGCSDSLFPCEKRILEKSLI